jgi:thiamine biosynthesis lipoprotein
MKDLSRFEIRLLLGVFSLLLLASCGSGYHKDFVAGDALGTTYNITYITEDPLELQNQFDSVFRAVNRSMSTYLPDSDISRINRGDSTIVIDTMFREVMGISRAVFENTQGYFDPTVGILVNAWGFGPGPQMIMDSSKVDSLLTFVGFDKITLSPDHTIKKQHSGITLDFNAVAKGYTIDRLAAVLDQHNVQHYLIELGGELVAKGINLSKEQPWVVGIDDPQAEGTRALKLKIQLKDRALASSGNYRKFRVDTLNGRRYVHTIDPITGFTKNSNVLSASVIANSCAVADAYATAFMAMDLDESIKLLVQQKELEAYIIYLDEGGRTADFMTTGFGDQVVK